jgi:hypothetical protein
LSFLVAHSPRPVLSSPHPLAPSVVVVRSSLSLFPIIASLCRRAVLACAHRECRAADRCVLLVLSSSSLHNGTTKKRQAPQAASSREVVRRIRRDESRGASVWIAAHDRFYRPPAIRDGRIHRRRKEGQEATGSSYHSSIRRLGDPQSSTQEVGFRRSALKLSTLPHRARSRREAGSVSRCRRRCRRRVVGRRGSTPNYRP